MLTQEEWSTICHNLVETGFIELEADQKVQLWGFKVACPET